MGAGAAQGMQGQDLLDNRHVSLEAIPVCGPALDDTLKCRLPCELPEFPAVGVANQRRMQTVSEDLHIQRFEGAAEGQCVLRLVGPLTARTTSPLENVMRGEDATTLIIDLAQVPYVDSVGLGSLVGAYVSCQKAGKRIALSGANRRVVQLFEITKVDTFLLSFASLEQAVEALTNAGNA
jgi:anti-sigma B factor antagonist